MTDEFSIKEYMKKLDDANKEEAYKIFEKEGHNLGHDITNEDRESYWKFWGEAENEYGKIIFHETKETLLGKKGNNYINSRPEFINSLLDNEKRIKIANVLPEKCDKCGFHRFMDVCVSISSIGNSISIICPNCRKELIEYVEV